MSDKKQKYEAAIAEFEQVYNRKPKPPRNREDYAWRGYYDEWFIEVGKAYENMKNAEKELRGDDE